VWQALWILHVVKSDSNVGFAAVAKTMPGVERLKLCKGAFRVAGAVQVTSLSEMLGGS